MKKVSVIIPVYNVEEYLEECMESVIHQTLKEIEILCVNDGSTDHSLQILEQYAKKDDRIRIISQKNGGYGKAMNQGLDAASGEYIGIVEPDDYVPLNMYEDLYRKAKEQNLDFVKADFYRFVTAENGNKELYYKDVVVDIPEDQAFYLTDEGIVIYFGVDEIAPKEFGIPRFTMEYKKFAPYINPRFYCTPENIYTAMRLKSNYRR